MTNPDTFMKAAIDLALNGLQQNEGGPFGCVVVKNGKIIGRGNNKVTSTNDPTAHAEVVAIRDACATLNSFQLEGCEIYTSCEPCPMCMGAIYWARPAKVYYAGTRFDAADAGFDDSFIYEELDRDFHERTIQMVNVNRQMALDLFEKWNNKKDKTAY